MTRRATSILSIAPAFQPTLRGEAHAKPCRRLVGNSLKLAFNAGQCNTWEADTDYVMSGSPVGSPGAANSTDCLSKCRENADCNAVTYAGTTCHMFNVTESAVPSVSILVALGILASRSVVCPAHSLMALVPCANCTNSTLGDLHIPENKSLRSSGNEGACSEMLCFCVYVM